MTFFNHFNGNPFTRTSCTDYLDLEPFIEKEVALYLKHSLITNFDSQWSFHCVMRGERGCGKTAHLLYLGKIIRDKHSPNLIDDYVRGVEEVFKSPFHLFRHILERLNENYDAQIPTGMMDFQKKLKELLGTRKYYFLVDVPDSLSKKNLDDFVNTVEYLIGVHNVSIIIAMNISHFEKSFAYSEVLGKFRPEFIKLFSFEDTLELVSRRLKLVSIDSQNDGISPFTEDALKIIQNISGGIPRLILTKCDKLFEMADIEHVSIIDYGFAEQILKNTYVTDTLSQRVPDMTMRQTLLDVYNILKDDLKGVAISQQQFINKVKEKGLYNNHITILKKINMLDKLHLVTRETDPKDCKSKIYKIVI